MAISNKRKFLFLSMFSFISLFSCKNETKKTLFNLIPSSRTGIDFNNRITESDSINILTKPYLYNGAGVGVGDFNNDGKQDIFFAGNMVESKLYLNEGDLKFDDITKKAGINTTGKWCAGVAVVDINNDGYQDIYVCASFNTDANRRKNMLFVNQGLNKEGMPTFKEEAQKYGIDDSGYSTQGVFFDYDNDGLLDLYVLTNVLDDGTRVEYRPKVEDGSAANTDRLYHNNGDGTFTNVSKKAGIVFEGFGNSVSVADINNDGYQDIYVGNDFISNDLLYINNKNGTFSNRAKDYFKHTGWSVMGSDIVDVNNDGEPDLISLEMLPEGNSRKKTMLMGDNYITYINNNKFNYDPQYIRNVFQLNQGQTPSGHPQFGDVAYQAGVFETDWSWAPLVADFDNDGFRDMVFTNGYPRDVTDLDHALYSNGQNTVKEVTTLAAADSFPVVKIASYAFKNMNGDKFNDASKKWGITQPGFSTGGVYVDLDNDGDLDMVVNNIDDEAFVYENRLKSKDKKDDAQHYLNIKFNGEKNNINGIGAAVRIYYGGKQQYYDQQPTRGYMSTHEDIGHFGLGNVKALDSLRIRWPDGITQLLTNVKTDQKLVIKYTEASGFVPAGIPFNRVRAFSEVSKSLGINYKHEEKDAIDYNIQRTLPHKLSQYGPCLAVGDIDNNGYDDFFIGGAAGNQGVFYMQNSNGTFTLDRSRFIDENYKEEEDMGAILFDANGDGHLDLYIASGSYEFPKEHSSAQDRLYINNGKGKFKKDLSALPNQYDNSSTVRAADFDGDGDLDLFVGGRSVSGAYPSAPKSHLFVNESRKFVDETARLCPKLENSGMITDALFSDFDGDGKVDLVTVGEWMPMKFYKNNGHGFTKVENTGVQTHIGWWNSIVAGDFNNDGKMDYAAGNLGQNSNYKASFREPMTIIGKDIDGNGSFDAMIFCYSKAEDESRKQFPMNTRDDMISQVLGIRKKFPTYKLFDAATMNDIWSEDDKKRAIILNATDMNSSIMINKGGGNFEVKALPMSAQEAPVYGMFASDVDLDGNLDLVMVGNDYGMEPFTGRHDAMFGVFLKGDGKGSFIKKSINQSGFYVAGDGKSLAQLHSAKGYNLLLASQNQDSLMVFKSNRNQDKVKWIKLQPEDFFAESTINGTVKKTEFYYGSTFLSQSTRMISVNERASAVYIYSFDGKKRRIE